MSSSYEKNYFPELSKQSSMINNEFFKIYEQSVSTPMPISRALYLIREENSAMLREFRARM
jgi:hypothetical protein